MSSLALLPDINTFPAVLTALTDSHYFRDSGITCDGFDPSLIHLAQEGGVHGNNERPSIENLRRGRGYAGASAVRSPRDPGDPFEGPFHRSARTATGGAEAPESR